MKEKIKKEAKYNEPKINLNLIIYNTVGKYKSIRRAIKRGHVTSWGEELPSKPFNNRKRTPGRELQSNKEMIYGRIKYNQRYNRA